jgi:TetR/AcrR family transcriptional regulator, cholesterol catabolism regulator
MEPGKYMKISELSRQSGVPVDRIRYYITKEILPKPIKANKTSAFYTSQHMERLALIERLQSNNDLPISVIKEMINSVIKIEGSGTPLSQAENPSVVRDQLVSTSIEVFRRKGYEGTTITDIVEAANVARNTFYRYFKSKEELFLECLNEIFFGWRREVPREQDSLLTEENMRASLNRTFVAVHKAFPRWSDMMNLLRVAALKEPEVFADKLQRSLDTRIKPIVDDINNCIERGIFRHVDPELLAMMFAGVAEYVCYYMYRDKLPQDPYRISDQTIDIFFHGVLAEKGTEETHSA